MGRIIKTLIWLTLFLLAATGAVFGQKGEEIPPYVQQEPVDQQFPENNYPEEDNSTGMPVVVQVALITTGGSVLIAIITGVVVELIKAKKRSER